MAKLPNAGPWLVAACLLCGSAGSIGADVESPQAVAAEIQQLRTLETSKGDDPSLRSKPSELAAAVRALAQQDAAKKRSAPPLAMAPQRPDPATTRLLRDTAFDLDKLAHRLEMGELYNQADRIRAMAGDLRLAARPIGHATSRGHRESVLGIPANGSPATGSPTQPLVTSPHPH